MNSISLKTNLFRRLKRPLLLGAFAAAAWSAFPLSSAAGMNLVEVTEKTAENQVRRLLEPVLDKYCRDECRLMSVGVTVDSAVKDEVAPGFDGVESSRGGADLAPSSGVVKILVDEKVGKVSRGKLMDLLQQYLDTLDYPVKIDAQVVHFPEPIESAGRFAELRDKVAKEFRGTIEDLFDKFCPNHCMLADFDVKADPVNAEEAQFGSVGEFVQDGSVALRIRDISATILVDDALSPEERVNILEMAKLKTNSFKNVTLAERSLKFPRASSDPDFNTEYELAQGGGRGRSIASEKSLKSDSNSQSTNRSDSKQSSTSNSTMHNNSESRDSQTKQEHFERFEKVERVESGDAIQLELNKFKIYGLIFACSVISLLIFIAMASMRPAKGGTNTIHKLIQGFGGDSPSTQPASKTPGDGSPMTNSDRQMVAARRYEIERLHEELMSIYAQQPKVAKQVFSRVLTEDGVETTADCIHLFGEGIVVDMLRDPSLQTDVAELMEYYAKTPIELNDDEKLELLKALHSRTVAGKLVVLGNRSSNLFDFISEMDGMQILEMVRTESLTVKAIVLTQCDPQKRSQIYGRLEEDVRMKLLTELSRIDHLPREYIYNVSVALKRKRKENPKLNTDSLPGSEVLISLLERTSPQLQKTVMTELDANNPESARAIKSKLVSIDTLRYLRDSQLLEVILSLKHDELLQFMKGCPGDIKQAIIAKSPKELIVELEEEVTQLSALSREAYGAVERKVLNRMKMLANDGLINLAETNERMFSDAGSGSGFVEATSPNVASGAQAGRGLRSA